MKTKWSLNELARYRDEPLMLTGEIDVEEELKARSEQVIAIAPVEVDGALTVDGTEYILYVNLSYTLTLPSSRSLEPVDVTMNLPVSEVYLPADEQPNSDEERDVLLIELEQDWIDLKEILVDNILAALPSNVLTKEEKEGKEMPKGKGWQVLTEDDSKDDGEAQGDPRFAALKSLFDDEADSRKED